MVKPVKAYLLLYNIIQLLGWSFALWRVGETVYRNKYLGGVYAAASGVVRLCQGTAILEVAHAATGIVRGSPATAFLQWFGRSNILFAVLGFVPKVRQDWAVPLLFVAWAVADIVRYAWYAAAQLGQPPHWLTWLRYTLFIPLYPLGILAEVSLIYNSLPFIKQHHLHSITLPNNINFAFSYYYFSLVGLFVLYPLAFPWLFNTLLQQRRKRLGPQRAKHE